MKINVQNLLKSNSENFDWTKIPINKFYKSKIIETFFGESKFGGETFKVIFEILDKDFLGRNISLFMTYTNKFGHINSDFIEFVKNFIDLKNVENFETEELIEKECNIFIENNKNNTKFQEITKINTIFEKEN